ncbi:hypothetical protein C8Q80DRAFT_433011 [Daedaleopsis nitida]|nr:hypothetical protein C8Q80DRAFT_433011 [Daedaleopsis nitida]
MSYVTSSLRASRTTRASCARGPRSLRHRRHGDRVGLRRRRDRGTSDRAGRELVRACKGNTRARHHRRRGLADRDRKRRRVSRDRGCHRRGCGRRVKGSLIRLRRGRARRIGGGRGRVRGGTALSCGVDCHRCGDERGDRRQGSYGVGGVRHRSGWDDAARCAGVDDCKMQWLARRERKDHGRCEPRDEHDIERLCGGEIVDVADRCSPTVGGHVLYPQRANFANFEQVQSPPRRRASSLLSAPTKIEPGLDVLVRYSHLFSSASASMQVAPPPPPMLSRTSNRECRGLFSAPKRPDSGTSEPLWGVVLSAIGSTHVADIPHRLVASEGGSLSFMDIHYLYDIIRPNTMRLTSSHHAFMVDRSP